MSVDQPGTRRHDAQVELRRSQGIQEYIAGKYRSGDVLQSKAGSALQMSINIKIAQCVTRRAGCENVEGLQGAHQQSDAVDPRGSIATVKLKGTADQLLGRSGEKPSLVGQLELVG